MKKHFYINICIALFLCVFYICFANVYSFPWIDEIYFSAPAFNFINGNGWNTAGIANPYPPLYSILLGVWFLLFGHSHAVAVSFEIFLALVCYCLLLIIVNKRGLFKKPISYYVLLLLYWLGFYMPTIFTMGRVDMLVMLLVIILIDSIIPSDDTLKASKIRVFFASTLLPFTAIYPLPLIVYVLICLYIFDINNRKQYRVAGLVTFCGFIIGFVLALLFIYRFDESLWVIHRMFTMAASGKVSILDKLIKAYHDIPALLLFSVSVFLLYHKKTTFINAKYLLFIVAIPALMLLAGRYERYYWWMMYIPVIIIFVKSIESYSKRASVTALSVVALVCIASQLFFMQFPSRYVNDYFDMDYSYRNNTYIEKQVLAKELIEENDEFLTATNNGVFSSALFYYQVANNGVNCWYINNAIFPDSLKQVFNKHDRSKFYWRFYEDFLRPNRTEIYPTTGVFFSIDRLSYINCVDFLERELFSYRVIDEERSKDAKAVMFERTE